MEKDIVDGKIGEVGAYDLEFKQGQLKFTLIASHAVGIEGELAIKVSADAVIDAIAKAIPGQVDDAVLGLIKQALKV
jgi:hypothetical protein